MFIITNDVQFFAFLYLQLKIFPGFMLWICRLWLWASPPSGIFTNRMS